MPTSTAHPPLGPSQMLVLGRKGADPLGLLLPAPRSGRTFPDSPGVHPPGLPPAAGAATSLDPH